MGVLHKLEAMADGGLAGLQAGQRDWSPYVAHFTTWSAMESLRSAITDGQTPSKIRDLLRIADEKSFETLTNILTSRTIRASSPAPREDLAPCVCLSECTLPGLIAHAERFGRCGLVFSKTDIYAAGGRPCFYVASDVYAELERLRKLKPDPGETMHSLANVYTPPTFGKVQDFTHEREWRIFRPVDLENIKPAAFVVPDAEYHRKLSQQIGGDTPILPLKTLYRWGV